MPESTRAVTAARADAWFGIYFQLGAERSLANLHAFLGELGVKISQGTLENYSVRYNWQARVAELDIKAAERTQERLLGDVAEMNVRQAQLGRGLQEAVKGRIDLQKDHPLTLSASDIPRWAEIGVKLERLAIGEATDRREIVVGIFNPLLESIVDLFREVNELADSQERLRRFAIGVDDRAARLLPEGRG